MAENFLSVAKHLFLFLFHVAKKTVVLIKTELNSPFPSLKLLICNQGIRLKSAYWQLLISFSKVAIRN